MRGPVRKVRVVVAPWMVDGGLPESCRGCPVALAIQTATCCRNWEVRSCTAEVHHDGLLLSARLPSYVWAWIDRFDALGPNLGRRLAPPRPFDLLV